MKKEITIVAISLFLICAAILIVRYADFSSKETISGTVVEINNATITLEVDEKYNDIGKVVQFRISDVICRVGDRIQVYYYGDISYSTPPMLLGEIIIKIIK